MVIFKPKEETQKTCKKRNWTGEGIRYWYDNIGVFPQPTGEILMDNFVLI